MDILPKDYIKLDPYQVINDQPLWYLIFCYSPNIDDILDPFCGTSSTGCAALFHNRAFIGVDINNDYINISRDRIQSTIKGTLKHRTIGTVIQSASDNTKTKQFPEEWENIRKQQEKLPRLYPQYKNED